MANGKSGGTGGCRIKWQVYQHTEANTHKPRTSRDALRELVLHPLISTVPPGCWSRSDSGERVLPIGSPSLLLAAALVYLGVLPSRSQPDEVGLAQRSLQDQMRPVLQVAWLWHCICKDGLFLEGRDTTCLPCPSPTNPAECLKSSRTHPGQWNYCVDCLGGQLSQ